MKFKYLKVYTDFVQTIEPLGDAEKGRLFVAMLKYAESGEEPRFSGSERFIWPTAKLTIDREAAFCEKQKRNGEKHTSQQEPNEAKASQQEPGEAKASQTSQKEKKRNTNETEKKRKDNEADLVIICADKPRRFTPPTLAEVRAYCRERMNNVDASRFVDYYASNGWKVGKNPMKDWRAAVRTWEKSDSGGRGQEQPDRYANIKRLMEEFKDE